MKSLTCVSLCGLLVICAFGPGCSSTPAEPKSTPGPGGLQYRATDKLNQVYVADGFLFAGYDVLVLAPVTVDPAVRPKDDKESERLEQLKLQLPADFAGAALSRHIVGSTVMSENELKPGAKALKLELTVLDFSRGSTSARVMWGFGAGMPYIKVRGALTALGDAKPLFVFSADERGDWLGAGYSSSGTVQAGATMTLARDVADFMVNIRDGKPIRYKK